jgi:transposase
MNIRKAFQFKLKPTREQRQKMAQTAGCVRLVWNKSLGMLQRSTEKKGSLHRLLLYGWRVEILEKR